MIMFYDKLIFFKINLNKYKYINKLNFNYFFSKFKKKNIKIEWTPNHWLINVPKSIVSNLNIYYLRTQKRYNKMRYARTRRYSRVAFFVSLLALILFGQRLEWLFFMPTTYAFKIKWLINYILIVSPIYSLIKLNIYGIYSLLRIIKLYLKWMYNIFLATYIFLFFNIIKIIKLNYNLII